MSKYTTEPITKDTKLKFVFKEKKKDEDGGHNIIKYITIGVILVTVVGILVSIII